MRSVRHYATGAAVAVLGSAFLIGAAQAADAPTGDIEAGKAIAMDRTKGNCIACHMIPGGQSPGTIGPALIAIPSRYPTVDKLQAQIHDPTVANPMSAMPPFGKNRILTEKELKDVTAYIWSL